MNKNYLNILHKEVEIPQEFQEKIDTTLAEIRNSSDVKNLPAKGARRHQKSWVTKVAVIILACLLIPTATAVAAGLLNAYWQRMENMDEAAVEDYYGIGMNGETITYNRTFTEEEVTRLEVLRQKYLQGEVLPERDIKKLGEQETYQGDGVVLEESCLKVYLPDRTLSDEEILQIIDLDEKITYSVREVNQTGYGEEWRTRMEKMTMEEVDEVYFILYSHKCDVSGGYSRKLTESEQHRYDDILKDYEEKGLYTEAECDVILNVSDYTGEGLAICIQDGDYHLPERELTDEELLLIIDWEHKGTYCLERMNQEVDMGLRSGFPQTPYDVEPIDSPEIYAEEEIPDDLRKEEARKYDEDFAIDGISGVYDYANGGGTLTIERNEDDSYKVTLKLFEILSVDNFAGTYENGVLTVTGTDANGDFIEAEITFADGRAVAVFDSEWAGGVFVNEFDRL